MKKTWIWILVCALLVAVLPLSAGAQAPAGEPVASAEELAAMEPDGTYYLSADVTVTGEWQYAEFKGTLDGNGHTVYLDGATLSGGLFTALNGATVKNLSVQALSDTTFTMPSDIIDSFGVIAGRATGDVTLQNLVVQADVQVDSTKWSWDVGGLVGNARYGNLSVSGCVYSGRIGSEDAYCRYTGGILGSTWTGVTDLSITNCVTYGAYIGGGHTGGVIGGIQQDGNNGVTNLTLQYNVNYADVVNTGGAENAGGIIGYRCAPDGGSTRILNNINYGYVANSASNGKVGGIGGNFKQVGTPADNEISGNINYGDMNSVQVSPIYNNFYYDGTWAKDPRPAAVNNYTEEMKDSGENPVPVTTDVLNDGTLAALNAAYPGTYAMLDGRITLIWALEAGYTAVLPAAQEPAYLGYQLSAPTEDGKRGIRFVATLNDLDCADAVGIQIRAITATGQSRLWLQDTDVVYTSVLADGTPVTPADFGSKDQYLYTAMLGNIPVSEGSITFEIRTFVVKDGATAYSPATTVTVDVSAAAE